MAKRKAPFAVASAKKDGMMQKIWAFFSDERYPVFFTALFLALYLVNYFVVKNPIVFLVTASVAVFFLPGYVLLDLIIPPGALEDFVERWVTSIALSICFIVLAVSIVNLGLKQPLSRDVFTWTVAIFNLAGMSVHAAWLKTGKPWNSRPVAAAPSLEGSGPRTAR